MSSIQAVDPRTQRDTARGGEWNDCPDLAHRLPRDMTRFRGDTRHGSAWTIAGLIVLSLAVVGAIRLWPDFVRYVKIRNM
jgi:hypothetical protein